METGLKLASNVRFVYSKSNQTQKTVNLTSSNPPPPPVSQKKTPGRKQSDPLLKKKTAESALDAKNMKLEWGKAYKHINDNKEASNPIFLDLSAIDSCKHDPYYVKMMREMAYGIFPKGIFYDKNRGSLVCSEAASKRNETVRKQRINKYIRVCLPGRELLELDKTTTTTTTVTNFTTTGEEDGNGKRYYRLFNRCHQKGDMSLTQALELLEGSLDKLFREVKLFMYINMDVISPKDELLLRDDTQHVIQNFNYINNLKSPQPWKRLNQVEKVSLIGHYCTISYLREVGKNLDGLSKLQHRKMTEIKNYLIGLYITGLLKDAYIKYDNGNVTSISNVTISQSGIKVSNTESPEPSSETELTIQPIVIQRYKSVDLQKINTGVMKQDAKLNKSIVEMTEKD